MVITDCGLDISIEFLVFSSLFRKVLFGLSSCVFIVYLLKVLFNLERQCVWMGRGRGRGGAEAEADPALSAEPSSGLDSTTRRAWPQGKPRVGCLMDGPTQPTLVFLNKSGMSFVTERGSQSPLVNLPLQLEPRDVPYYKQANWGAGSPQDAIGETPTDVHPWPSNLLPYKLAS